MLIEHISPFVRFTARQAFTEGQKNMVAYDHRIYFCLKNTGLVTVNGKEYLLQPNSFLMWRAGMTYSYRAKDYSAPIEVATCNFDFTRIAQAKTLPIPPSPAQYFNRKMIVSEPAVFENNEVLNGVVYIKNAASLRGQFLSLVKEYNAKLRYYGLNINTILQNILFETVRLTGEISHSKSEELASAVLKYIQEEYLSAPSNEEIGKLFNYHPNYINALVMKYTGKTLHNYIITLKLTEAMRLLMETDLNISEIAARVNIPDSHYFSQLFKRYFGKSPSQFKFAHLG